MPSLKPLHAAEPIADLNTTPLIDVMLVLLVMIFLSIPLATHSLDIDLPSGQTPVSPQPVLSTNHITLSPEGVVGWNGQSLSEAQLAATLAAAQMRVPEPLVLFEPSGDAAYGASARVLRIIKASGLRSFAFVGTEKYGQFGKVPARR